MATTNTSFIDRARRFLHRQFPGKRQAASVAMLTIVAMAGFLSLNHIKGKAALIVGDTLPGLAAIGLANADLAQDFNCVLLTVMAPTPQEQTRFRTESDQFDQQSKQFLDEYEAAIFAADDRALFDRLSARRKEYRDIRGQVFELMGKHDKPEAVSRCRRSLLPAYVEFKATGEKLLEYNTLEGQSRGESILQFCGFTRYSIASFTIALFMLGFIIGLFK